jgi:hypothetical protein
MVHGLAVRRTDPVKVSGPRIARGRPSRLPRRFAAASPALVRSRIRSRSNSARARTPRSSPAHERAAGLRGCWFDCLVEHDQVDAQCRKFGSERGEMTHGAREPAELHAGDRVEAAAPGVGEHAVERRPGGLGAALAAVDVGLDPAPGRGPERNAPARTPGLRGVRRSIRGRRARRAWRVSPRRVRE